MCVSKLHLTNANAGFCGDHHAVCWKDKQNTIFLVFVGQYFTDTVQKVWLLLCRYIVALQDVQFTCLYI